MTLFERPRPCRLLSLRPSDKGSPAMEEHSHTEPPSAPTLRIKALDLCWSRRASSTPARSTRSLTSSRSASAAQRRQGRGACLGGSAYKKRLLEDGSKAIAELGFTGLQGEDMVVLENTPKVHNVVVCTLCSCYPWPTMGLPPNWYKAAPYRARSSSNRARCSPSLASASLRTLRFAFGTAMPRSARWCCRCGRPALTAGTKRGSPSSYS